MKKKISEIIRLKRKRKEKKKKKKVNAAYNFFLAIASHKSG
jgi:hypothetical protein